MQKPYITIIIPCYNEGPTFEKSVGKIIGQLKKLKRSWEIIFIEDKSTDGTKSSVEKIVNNLKSSAAIYHKKNTGRGKSVEEGINQAKGDICGFLDVDLEVSERYIPVFIKEVEKGADLVVGKRFYESGFKSIIRVVASKFYALVIKVVLDLPVDDTEAGYKFFRRKTILPILKKTNDKHWFWDTEICARASQAGLVVNQLPVLFIRRPEKKSTVKLLPDSITYISSLIKFRSDIKKHKE